MSKKFDTNPLDPEFPEKARAAAANTSPQPPYGPPETAPQSPYRTAEFPAAPLSSVTEEETKKFGEADFQAYWHNNYQPAGLYQAPPAAAMNRASSRTVPKVGLPEKWLIGLPYLPYIGLFAGIILLLIIPKEESKVRFHASQGLAANIAVWIISSILGAAGNFTGVADVAQKIFGLVSTVMLIIFAIKAWRGKPVHIESIDDLTNWLEEKIGPVK